MLKVTIVRTMNGFRAVFGYKVIAENPNKDETVRRAKMYLGAEGYRMAQVQFIGA